MPAARPSCEPPVLVTARLRLRPPADRDTAAIVAIAGDRAVARHLSRVPHPYDPADARFFLEHVVPAGRVWAITATGDDTLVGVIGLEGDGGAEPGYRLSPSRRGAGLMTEAAHAVVARGFAALAPPGLTAGCFEGNRRRAGCSPGSASSRPDGCRYPASRPAGTRRG